MVKKITIQDVAREAGTSASTVSRVLTGSAPVNTEKRAAIEEAINRLHFRPSLIARGLKTNTTCTIGLLINDIANPFYSLVAKGAEAEAMRHGYSLLLCNSNEDPEIELHHLQVFHDKHVDGIIFGPTGHNLAYIRELAKRIPLVQADRHFQCLETDAVLADNEAGAYQAVRLLIERGHRRIGLLGWEIGITSEDQRIAGYDRALDEAGIPADPALHSTSPAFSPQNMDTLAQALIALLSRPTAIFATNNQFGLVALRAVRRAGLHIPGDMALVVFDDLDVFSLTSPPIAAVAQPAYDIGRRAVQLLLARIGDGNGIAPRVEVLPTQLVVRESV